MRRGFSLIELVIVILLTSISAAVVVPAWSAFQADHRLRAAALAFGGDLQALQRYAARHNQPLSLSMIPASGEIVLNPPLPQLVGTANGTIEYHRRYPGIVFGGTPFGSDGLATISERGDLLDSQGQRITQGSLMLSLGSQVLTFDILQLLNLELAP